jgi:hypothetical protein
MFKVLLLLIASAGAGYLLRRNSGLRKTLSRTTPVTIFILLFMFGMSIGSNESILSNIHKDGLKAGAIALLGVAGSIVATTACIKIIKRKGGLK